MGLTAGQVSEYKHELQRNLLALNKIDFTDRPGGVRNPYMREWIAQGYEELRPWSVYLGELPIVHGQTPQYRQNIRSQLQQLRAQFRAFEGIAMPVELDVQVRYNTQLIKDLDNIIRDIAPIFTEEVLVDNAHIHGYRIYTVDNAPEEQPRNDVRLKLLPLGAISQFDDNVDELFEEAKRWVRYKLERLLY